MLPIWFYYFSLVSIANTLYVFIFAKMYTKKNINKEINAIDGIIAVQQSIQTKDKFTYSIYVQLLLVVWALIGLFVSDCKIFFFAWILVNNIMPMLVKGMKKKQVIILYFTSILICTLIFIKHLNA